MSDPSLDLPIPGGAAKLISCILPDDGTERRLLGWLRDQQCITRANSLYCRGHLLRRGAVVRRGKLPEPSLMRLVSVVVDAQEADVLFDLIHAQVGIDRPGGGVLFMTPLSFATPFVLPEDLANEAGELHE
jgi:hypothetical protein